MRAAFLAISYCLCCTFVQGQEDDFSQFISACGEATLASGDTYSWTLGDLFTSEAVIVSKVKDVSFADFGIKLLGNPVSTQIRLQADQPSQLHCRLFDLQGRNLRNISFQQSNVLEIDVANLAPQVYFLSIFSTNEQLVGTFKIIKN